MVEHWMEGRQLVLKQQEAGRGENLKTPVKRHRGNLLRGFETPQAEPSKVGPEFTDQGLEVLTDQGLDVPSDQGLKVLTEKGSSHNKEEVVTSGEGERKDCDLDEGGLEVLKDFREGGAEVLKDLVEAEEGTGFGWVYRCE